MAFLTVARPPSVNFTVLGRAALIPSFAMVRVRHSKQSDVVSAEQLRFAKGGTSGSMKVQFMKMDWDSEKSYHSRILALELATNNGRLFSHQSI